MSAMGKWAASACLALVLAACTSFGTSDDGAQADAGADVGSAAETSNTGDANVDGASARLCPAGAFCDDFEGRKDVTGRWDELAVPGGQTLTLDTSQPTDLGFVRSSPTCLRAIAPANINADYVNLVKRVAGGKALHIEFSMRIAALDGIEYARIVSGTIDGHDFEVAVESGKYSAHVTQLDGRLVYISRTGTAAASQWLRVALDIGLTNPGSVVFSIGGSPVFRKDALAVAATTPQEVSVRLGSAAGGSNTATFDICYDDAIIETRP